MCWKKVEERDVPLREREKLDKFGCMFDCATLREWRNQRFSQGDYEAIEQDS